jgi:DoxX-like family
MKFAKKPYSPYVKAGSWRMQRQVHRDDCETHLAYSDDPHGCFGCNIRRCRHHYIIGRGTVKTDFARWNFPDGFNIVCGGLELVGAALLLPPSTRFWGLALLGMVMTGAIFSLLRYREPISHLAPALGIATLIALDAIALSAGSFLTPLP